MRNSHWAEEEMDRRSRSQDRTFGYYSPDEDDWDENEDWFDEDAEYDYGDADWEDEYDEEWDEEDEDSEPSRHLGQTKGASFRKKVNRLLFWVIVLVILLILAVIYI